MNNKGEEKKEDIFLYGKAKKEEEARKNAEEIELLKQKLERQSEELKKENENPK